MPRNDKTRGPGKKTMRTITIIAAAAAALCLVPAAASANGNTTDWTPMAVPSWSALGMVDRNARIQDGSTVTAWFRFVDAPGRPPAEDDPEVVDAMRDGGHVDLRASLDCRKRRFRVEGTRIVSPDERILDVGFVPQGQAFWVPLGSRTRASAVHAALCHRGRLR